MSEQPVAGVEAMKALTDAQLRGNIEVWEGFLRRGLNSVDDALDLINVWKRELARRAAAVELDDARVQNAERSHERVGSRRERQPRCEERPGIGLCDQCQNPMWPQIYVGYGMMVCLDCASPAERKAATADISDRAGKDGRA